jgi:hypothetical protein
MTSSPVASQDVGDRWSTTTGCLGLVAIPARGDFLAGSTDSRHGDVDGARATRARRVQPARGVPPGQLAQPGRSAQAIFAW